MNDKEMLKSMRGFILRAIRAEQALSSIACLRDGEVVIDPRPASIDREYLIDVLADIEQNREAHK